IPDLQQIAFEQACSRMILSGATLTVVGVSAFLTLKTIDLQQSRATSFVETLSTFLSALDGRFALYRGLLGLIFAGIFFAKRKSIFRRKGISNTEVALFLLIALIVLVRAHISHAAASQLLPNFSVFVTAVHLLAKEFWVGVLIAMTFVLMPVLIKL